VLSRRRPPGSDAPTTAVLTTDVTRFTMDVGDLVLDRRDLHPHKAVQRIHSDLGLTTTV
jgi:hypothetical protein